MREISEKVGLGAKLIEGFREELYYPLPRRPGYTKNTVYFLAEFAGQMPCCQPEKVSEVACLSYEQAMATLTFPDLKGILQKANAYLSYDPTY